MSKKVNRTKSYNYFLVLNGLERQTDRQMEKQTHTDRQTDRQTEDQRKTPLTKFAEKGDLLYRNVQETLGVSLLFNILKIIFT